MARDSILPITLRTIPTALTRTSSRRRQQLLQQQTRQLADLQDMLYAQNRWALLLIFQAMDGAGKDSTIKHVMSGVNPQGCQVFSFKQPSTEELDHDYLWRTTRCLPQRGRIGIFNRSYYEEVLVVRVHRELLQRQRIPEELITKKIWKHRYRGHRRFRELSGRNGIAVRKFFLHTSQGRAAGALSEAPGGAGEELEVLRRRHPRAAVLGRLPAGLRGYDSSHRGRTCTLVRGTSQQKVVRAPGGIDDRGGRPEADEARRIRR